MSEPIIINRAIVIEPGKTYVIECPRGISQDGVDRLSLLLGNLGQGNRFILLRDGVKIATEQVVVEEAVSSA